MSVASTILQLDNSLIPSTNETYINSEVRSQAIFPRKGNQSEKGCNIKHSRALVSNRLFYSTVTSINHKTPTSFPPHLCHKKTFNASVHFL